MRSFRHWKMMGIMAGVVLTGCNLPSSQQGTASIQTAAALTVQAQLTAAAPSPTVTPTAAAFPTLPPATAALPSAIVPPTAATSCDQGQFVSETVPDDTTFSADEAFVKTWTLKNIGTCSWTPSYTLVFVSGDALDGPATVALTGNVNPSQTVTLTANLKTPGSNGTYHGNWGLRNAAGVTFSSFWVQIKVGGGGSDGGEAFAVTHVTYSLSTFNEGSYYQDCPIMTAHITTNGPGDVTYRWTRSDSASASPQTVHFSSAGTKNVTEKWYLGSANAGSTFWLGIYVDDPNHQDFGHKEFTTVCSSP
jgi:hypothetical protein